MAVKCFAALVVLALGGCAGLPDWRLFDPVSTRASAAHAAGNFDFAWRLSGDPEVAPLQVFDNGRRMWLQFAPGQPVPAIFAHTPQGDRVLEYRREDPYVVLEHVWPRLVLRGGQQRSRIDRIGAMPSSPADGASGTAGLSAEAVSLAEGPASGSSVPGLEQASGTEQARIPSAMSDTLGTLDPMQPPSAVPAAKAAVPAAGDGAQPVAQAVVPADVAIAAPTAQYDVSPRDRNMRLALSRWAALAGWTFDAEHWSVDSDIPIAGSAQFQTDFKQAVQALMAATELADRPLQPCFYSNKVLRIVPYAQPCNRVAALSRGS